MTDAEYERLLLRAREERLTRGELERLVAEATDPSSRFACPADAADFPGLALIREAVRLGV